MDAVKSHLKQKVQESLHDLIEQAVATVDEEAVADILREELRQLTGEPLQKDAPAVQEETPASQEEASCAVEAQWYPQEQRLAIAYSGPGCHAMARQQVLDDRAMILELDEFPQLMETVTIDVVIGDQADAVAMQGRVVHAQGSEVALEIFSLQGELRKVLEQSLDPESGNRPSTQPVSVAEDNDDDGDDDGASSLAVDRLIELEEARALDEWVFDGDQRAELFYEVADSDSYRLLEVLKGETTLQFLFHRHTLIGVRQEPCLDWEALIIDQLRKSGVISDEDRERAQVLATLHGISIQDGLIDIGAIDVEGLLGAIENCLADHLRDLWQMEEGTKVRIYELDGRPQLRLRRASIPLMAFMVRQLLERSQSLSEAQLEAFHDRCRGKQFVYDPPPPLRRAQDVFPGPYKRFVEVILAEERYLSELDRITKFNQTHCLRFLWVIDRLEALSFDVQKVEMPEHSQIRGLYRGLEAKTPFQVLELHWSAYGGAVEEAYQKMGQRLDVPEEVRRDMGDEIEAIEEAVEEAYQLLKSRRRRKQLRQNHTDRLQRQSAIDVYERQLDSFQMRQAHDDIEDTVRRILELRPSHSAAKKWLKAIKERRRNQG